MNLQQLSNHAQAGRIEQLELISIEGGFYLLNALMLGTRQVLLDDDERPLRLRSVDQAKRTLAGLNLPFFLVHASAHDEMCGLAEVRQEPLRIAIQLDS